MDRKIVFGAFWPVLLERPETTEEIKDVKAICRSRPLWFGPIYSKAKAHDWTQDDLERFANAQDMAMEKRAEEVESILNG